MRLIDADNLNARARAGYGCVLDAVQFQRFVSDEPTVDAVPVVRCRNCKFGEPMGTMGVACHNPKGLHFLGSGKRFCSYGERKDGEK